MLLLVTACTKKEDPIVQPKLIVKLAVDPNQVRLGNIGNVATIPAGNAGQNLSLIHISEPTRPY